MLANVGVPMIFPQLFLMVFAFVPVVVIEALLVRKAMGLNIRSALWDVAVANLWTTLLGVPLAWIFTLVVEMVGIVVVGTVGGAALDENTPVGMLASVALHAAWIEPDEQHMIWMIPAAATFLLVPCFLVSLFIERLVLAHRWAGRDRKSVYSAVLRANVWSYVFLFVAGSVWTIFGFK